MSRKLLLVGFLSLLVTSVYANKATTIRGLYLVEHTNTCNTVRDPSLSESSLSVGFGANGLPQVYSSQYTKPAINYTVYQLKINPITRTMTGVRPTIQLLEGGGTTAVWRRTDRTYESTFAYDFSDDTLVITKGRLSYIDPYDGSFMDVITSGARFRTIDNGDSFIQVADKNPIIGKLTKTLGSDVSYYSIVCISQVTGKRISTQF